MMRHAIESARRTAEQWGMSLAGVLWATEPDNGPDNSFAVRRMRMFEKMGAQVRRDLRFQFDGQAEPEGEVILWYPMLPDLRQVTTKTLAWQLWAFGGLPAAQFVKRYGDIGHVEPGAEGDAPNRAP